MMRGRRFLIVLIPMVMLAYRARADTLFVDLGGRSGLEKLAGLAVETWTHDPRVSATFDETNPDRLRRLLFEQLCKLTDGGCVYSGRDMREAHRGLHLDTLQFNVVVEDLQTAMEQLDIPFSVQNKLLAKLAPMYRDVVTW